MCSYNYIGDCASAIITVLINGKCGEYSCAVGSSAIIRFGSFSMIRYIV